MTVKKLWPHQMNDFWGSRAVKGKSRLWWRDGRRRRRTKSPGAYKGSSRHPSLGDGSQMSDPAGLLQLIWNERLFVFLFNHFVSVHKEQNNQSVFLGLYRQLITFKVSHLTHKTVWDDDLNIVPAQMHVCVCVVRLVPPAALLTYISSSLCQTKSKSKSLSLHLVA